MTQTQRHRLPLSVSPQRYEIRLEPDLNAARFSGEEKVVLEVHEPVDRLTLNAAELEISGVRLTSATGNALAGDVRLDAENEQAILRLPETVAPGMYELQLAFSGILNDKLHGFYRSTYKSPAGEQKTLASTQFESTDARRAFPCWDEPAFKAVFQVTLVIDEHLTAISNARIMRESSLPGTGKKTIMFADTIKMSTYLVAFIVGEFEGTEPTMVGNTPLRVWAVPGKNRLGRFGQEAGAFSLRFFSDYYGIPYPGDKLDLVAIPDFASGAMENLGAITFRETALLVDEEKATRSELERVADVVSHENAHMWFGDLVTMRWWNGLWLNEAFATFMEMLAVDAWKPQWRRWDSFTVSRAAAMQVDGLKSTRAIEFPVERPEEAAGMFDVLTYEKGASVLRMLEQYLGAERFRDGIRLYLRRHAYANAETTDLWDAIEEATREPVRAMMDTWIFQPGLPLIRVERVGREIRLSQQLFRYLEPSEPVTERRWHVPVLLRFHTEREASERWVLLTDRELRLEAPESLESVVVNAGGHGFYRVWYSPDLLRALTQRLQSTLKPVERFNWVNDTWAVTLAGLGSLPDYLEVIDMMRDETDVNVWTSVIASCHQLYRILDDAQWRLFQTRVRGALSPAVERLGWSPRDGEPELESQLRADLISALGTLAEDAACQARARNLYAQYEKDGGAVDRNLVPALVAICAHTGGENDYERFFARFKSAQTPQEEMRYLFALAGFRQKPLIARTLELTINGEVRTQNAPYLMRSLLLNKDAREEAWKFMKSHWQQMTGLYPDNSIPRMCEGIVGLVSRELEADARRFFEQHPVRQGAKQIEQHLERLAIAVACRERWNHLLRGSP